MQPEYEKNPMATVPYDVGDQKSTPWARGVLLFAGALLLVAGVFQALQGIAVLDNPDGYRVTSKYTYDVSETAWGWAHLIVGLLIVLISIGVLLNKTWGRALAVPLVVISMFENFLFIANYPLWTLVILGVDVLVLWALVAAPTRDF